MASHDHTSNDPRRPSRRHADASVSRGTVIGRLKQRTRQIRAWPVAAAMYHAVMTDEQLQLIRAIGKKFGVKSDDVSDAIQIAGIPNMTPQEVAIWKMLMQRQIKLQDGFMATCQSKGISGERSQEMLIQFYAMQAKLILMAEEKHGM